MTNTGRTRCRGGLGLPETRIDRLHRALPLWQQFVLWFVAMTAAFRIPPAVAPEQPLRGLLTLGLLFGLFAGQVLLFTWLNKRW